MTRRLAFVLALGLGACVTSPAPRGPATLAESAEMAPEGPRRAAIHLADQAVRALGRGEIQTAQGIASRALRVDQHSPYAHYAMARVALAEHKWLAAERDTDQALRLLEARDPQNQVWRARLFRLRARALEAQDRPDEAARARREAERLDRSTGTAYRTGMEPASGRER